MEYLASYSGFNEPILQRGAEAQSFVDAGLAEVGLDNDWHSTVLEHAIEGGIITSEADQNRFLTIAESERMTGRVKWAAWRGVKMALALLPMGQGAGGAVFARAPQSTTAALDVLNKATAAAKLEGARERRRVNVRTGDGVSGTRQWRHQGGDVLPPECGEVRLSRPREKRCWSTQRGRAMPNFVNKSGEFYKWFAGRTTLIEQALRQIKAAKGMAIEWHFAEESALKATQKLLNDAHITGIKLVLR